MDHVIHGACVSILRLACCIERRLLAAMDLGLGRVQALLQRVGSPQFKFPVIHVSGTNGKGSTTAYLDAFLTHAVGLRSARFNTPHLLFARDSLRTNGGIPIDEKTWEIAVQKTRLADACDVPIGATPFELLTVQALLACTLLPTASQPDILLIEVGVGGRLDATNVFPSENVLASVICPIARDHEALLGNCLSAIALEKTGIIKPQGLCIISDQTRGTFGSNPTRSTEAFEVLETLHSICQAQHARVVYTQIPWASLKPFPSKEPFRACVDLSLPLFNACDATKTTYDTSSHVSQRHVRFSLEATLARVSGASTALQTLWSIAHDISSDQWNEIRELIRKRLFEANPSLIAFAAAQYRWEGRCEWMQLGTVPLLLDGAHNEASAFALRQYLDQCLAMTPSAHITWIMGFSSGKEVQAMLQALLRPRKGLHHRVALVPFSTPVEGMPWVKTMLPEDCMSAVHSMNVECVTTHKSLQEALTWASLHDQHRHIIVICGSLYLISDYYRQSFT